MRAALIGAVAGALVAGLTFPAVATAAPTTVLMVHGGAWAAGGADVYERNGTADALRAAGFRVRSMDYADRDVPTAVRQVAGTAKALARKGRVVVWGDSAGGQLALMAAARCSCASGVVAVSAPSDLRGFVAGGYVTKDHVPTVLRGASAWAYSPLRAARAGLLRVPVVLVGQRRDPVVKWSRHTVPLYRALRAKGVRAAVVPVKGAAHEYMPGQVGAAIKFLTNNKTAPGATKSPRA